MRSAVVLATVMVASAGLGSFSIASAAPGPPCPGAGARPDRISLDKIRGITRCLINHRRARNSLHLLRGNHDLATAAKRHSRRMVEETFFSHSSHDGRRSVIDRIRRTGYLSGVAGYAVGEIILWGSRWKAKPRLALSGWMHSRGHRSIILDSTYREIGIGVARGAPAKGFRSAATYTVDFGRRWP